MMPRTVWSSAQQGTRGRNSKTRGGSDLRCNWSSLLTKTVGEYTKLGMSGELIELDNGKM
jgi:hypothetical protein